MPALAEREHRGHLATGDGPDGLVGLAHVVEAELRAPGRDVREDPFRIPQHGAHHVEDVRSEHDQVLAAGAVVLLAPSPHLVDLADLAGSDQFQGLEREGRPSHLVRQLDLDAGLADGLHHLIGVFQRGSERLLEVHVAASSGGRSYHLPPLVGVARADADDIGLLRLKHLPVVSVGVRGTGSLLRLGAAFLVRVGDCDYLGLGKHRPDVPDAVAIVAPAGVADDSDPVANLSAEWDRERAREEVPALHGLTIPIRRSRGSARHQAGIRGEQPDRPSPPAGPSAGHGRASAPPPLPGKRLTRRVRADGPKLSDLRAAATPTLA